jgi:hypothetical protein
MWCSFDGVHAANVLAVRVVPGGVLTGAADKTVRFTPIPDDEDDAGAAVMASRLVCVVPRTSCLF